MDGDDIAGASRRDRAPVVPGYDRLERIGSGGFSVVYRAYQADFDRAVAIKILNLAVSDPAAQRRFARECQLMGRLGSHPQILTVFASGVLDDDRPYLVMEYLEGGTLAEVGALPQEEVLRTGILVGSALAEVHGAGVLHRDVKPQNILLSKFGQPVLADFGVSALVQQGGKISNPMAVSPLYSAPDAFQGQPSQASDQYSLAATLYALLAGRAPSEGDQDESLAQVMFRVLEEEPAPLPPDLVHPHLWSTIHTGLAKEPVARHASVATLVEALQETQRQMGLPATAAVSGGWTTPRASPGAAGRVTTRPPLGGAATPPAAPAVRDAPPGHSTRQVGWPAPAPPDSGGARPTPQPPRADPDFDGTRWVPGLAPPRPTSPAEARERRPSQAPGHPTAGAGDHDREATGLLPGPQAHEEPRPSDPQGPPPQEGRRSSLLPVLVLVVVGIVLALVVLVLLSGGQQQANPPQTTAEVATPEPAVRDLRVDPSSGVQFTLTWDGDPTQRYRIFSYSDVPSQAGTPVLDRIVTATEAAVDAGNGAPGVCWFVVLEDDVTTVLEEVESEEGAMDAVAAADARSACVNGATVGSTQGG